MKTPPKRTFKRLPNIVHPKSKTAIQITYICSTMAVFLQFRTDPDKESIARRFVFDTFATTPSNRTPSKYRSSPPSPGCPICRVVSGSAMSRYAQPVVQSLTSFPAILLFSLFTLVYIDLGLSLTIGAIILMMLGVQWYIRAFFGTYRPDGAEPPRRATVGGMLLTPTPAPGSSHLRRGLCNQHLPKALTFPEPTRLTSR